MSSTFPLLNLPLVPLSNVLNTVKLNELLNISLCSKKSSKLTKSVRNKSEKVDIRFCNQTSEVSIKREKKSYSIIESFYVFDISELPGEQHEELNIGDMKVPITEGEYGSLNTYWENPFIGITKLLDLVTNFFDSPVHGLVLTAEKHPNDHRRIVDWIMRRQGSIARVYFECANTVEEELKYFMDTCKITTNLALVIKTSDQFKHTIHFELEILMLRHAHWLTLDNLFSLNCRYIDIDHSSLTSNDINKYLKHWLNGGSSRLGTLTLQTTKPAIIDVITAGLNAVLRTYNEDKVFKVLNEGHSITFNRSYDIQRNDGVMGSIVHRSNYINFLVWPDWEYTPYS